MTKYPNSTLGEVASITSGIGFPLNFQGKKAGDYPFAKVGDISRLARSGRSRLLSADNYIDQDELSNFGGRTIPEGSIVFAKIGEAIRQNFRAIVATPCLVDNNVMAITPNQNLLDSNYAYHLTRSINFYALADATTVPSIRKTTLARVEIPLPSLGEQRRIAEVLDRADALRAKRRQSITLLDDLARSLFLDMFGDPASNPQEWPVHTIGDLLESANYGTSEKSSTVGEIPVLRMGNITSDGRVILNDLKYMSGDIDDRHMVRTSDILFNRTNSADLVGKTALYKGSEPMAYAGYLVRIRTNSNSTPEYVSSFLNTAYAKRVLRGMCKSIVGMANINAKELQAIRIAQPPLVLQHEFASRTNIIDAARSTHAVHLAHLDALFASLQSRAFRGELWQDDLDHLEGEELP